jgi:hypothetical protein
MELITILNRCYRFRGFIYHDARFSPDKKSIEVAVRPRKGSAAICSRCHRTAPGYDQLAERRFEFIPLWGFSSSFCTPCAAWTFAAVVLWLSKKSLGRRQTHADQSLYAFPSPLGSAAVMERNGRGVSHFLG